VLLDPHLRDQFSHRHSHFSLLQHPTTCPSESVKSAGLVTHKITGSITYPRRDIPSALVGMNIMLLRQDKSFLQLCVSGS
jgi:hypothetical protein